MTSHKNSTDGTLLIVVTHRKALSQIRDKS